MSERDKTFALGVAAGAAMAAVGAAGAAAIRARGDRDESAPQADPPAATAEESSGRGAPAGGPDPESAKSGYDVRDAKVGALVKVMLVSLALMVGSTAAVFHMYARFDRAFQKPNAGLTAEQTAAVPPPLPHLQADPFRDLDVVRLEQTRRLETYGWNAPEHDSAHIPIGQAIQRVIGKPLDGPLQAETEAPNAAPSSAGPKR